MTGIRVGMIFGGRSVEHEVSVLTAHQAIAALPRERFVPVPIYIDKSGRWFTGDALLELSSFTDLGRIDGLADRVVLSCDATDPALLPLGESKSRLFGRKSSASGEPVRFDVAFPLIHGTHGEDGTVQGLLELANLPYAGSNVTASAVGNDKVLSKIVLSHAGLPVLAYREIHRSAWEQSPEAATEEIVEAFGFPVYVKPVTLGSSIGVSHADSADELAFAVQVALTYDSRAMVEPGIEGIIEVNCAVLGDDGGPRASVCEQPTGGKVLSYEDKYLTGDKTAGMKGAKRIVPAPIGDELTERVKSAAISTFQALGAAGVARVDFLVQPEEGTIYVNEINTMPGSLAFYLWEPAGLSFPALLETLIAQARRRHAEKQRNTYSFDVSLLDMTAGLAAKTGS